MRMKRILGATAVLGGALVIAGSLTARVAEQPVEMNEQERVGYAVGFASSYWLVARAAGF